MKASQTSLKETKGEWDGHQMGAQGKQKRASHASLKVMGNEQKKGDRTPGGQEGLDVNGNVQAPPDMTPERTQTASQL